MSLVGLVPPLSDNGRVLVDGGYGESIICLELIHSTHTFTVDNLPVSTMMRLGASTVFAVDVGSVSIMVVMMGAKRTLLNPRFPSVGRQYTTGFWRHCLRLVDVTQPIQSFLSCSQHP